MTSIREEAQDMADLGLPVGIVDWEQKFPAGFPGWRKRPPLDKYPSYEVEGTCLITGQGMEVVDVDSKHWQEDGDFSAIFLDWLKILPFYEKLVAYRTRSGGLQLPYRCSKVEGNQKLAKRLGCKEAIIETRGEGGLAVCPPSQGYEWIDGGEWEAVPTLTPDERDMFLESCLDWNQDIRDEKDVKGLEEARVYRENSGKPGDDWACKTDFIGYLESHGWQVDKVVGEIVLLRRPGKERGCSASWNYGGLKRLYVWSSSTELPMGQLLKPFAVKAYLEHDGNFKTCSMALREQGYGNEAMALADACEGANAWADVGLILSERNAILKGLGSKEWADLKLQIQSLGIKGVSEAKLDKLKKEVTISTEVCDWKEGLIIDGDGTVKGRLSNLSKIFDNDPAYKNVFYFDEFSQQILIRNPKKPNEPVIYDNDTMARMRVRLADIYGDFKPYDVDAIVISTAMKNRIHPLQERIKSLVWDARPRIDTWLAHYCGVTDTEYSRIVGRKWLIAAIARLFRPGCKADNVLVLEGAQGARKSTALRALCYGYFLDGKIDIRSKDGLLALFGKWIIEFSELEGMNGRSAEEVKNFLTKQEEHIRRPYGKVEQLFKRTCIFAATTNDDRYLTDGTGNRRFWPVKTGQIALERLRQDRDQLWAEALQAFRNGEHWWLDEDSQITEGLRVEQSSRVEQDELADEILEYAREHICIKIANLWADVYGGKRENLNRLKQKELAGILKRLGFKKEDRQANGVRMVGWFYES